jgi:DNA-binding transcriptional LysR family regulator
LGVPELWRFENRKLRIDVLRNGKYVQSLESPTFPNWSIIEIITEYVGFARSIGRSPALRAFRQWVKQQIEQ